MKKKDGLLLLVLEKLEYSTSRNKYNSNMTENLAVKEELNEEPTWSTETQPSKKPKRVLENNVCYICGQDPSDPHIKSNVIPGAFMEEEAALTDDRLLLYGDGDVTPDLDNKPIHKITKFSVFDCEGHLCHFDSGLIEKDQLLYFNGYIKPVYEENPSPVNGVPVQELGPIAEWWISGFDGGNSFLIALVTPYAEYILMEPSSEYEPYMRIPKQKALLTKIVIEFLNNSFKPTLDELLSRISEVTVPPDIEPVDEESIGKHAQFLIDQIREVDEKNKLMSTAAVVEIVNKYQVDVGNTVQTKRNLKLHTFSKPVTTPLVYKNFEFFFRKDKDKSDKIVNSKERDDLLANHSRKVSWELNSNFAMVENEKISIKDFVFIDTGSPVRSKMYRVEYFLIQNFTQKIHCSELVKATTVLRCAESNEYFFSESCSDRPLSKVICKAKMAVIQPPKIWETFMNYQREEINEGNFVEKKVRCNAVIFDDFYENDSDCPVCSSESQNQKLLSIRTYGERPIEDDIILLDKIEWKKVEYSVNCCVFLDPVAITFDAEKSSRRIEKKTLTLNTDETVYPEMYRKGNEASSKFKCSEPFAVVCIKKIFYKLECNRRKLFISVNKFYRPENTRILDVENERDLDPRLLYWSDEEVDVLFEYVVGRCDVVYSKNPPEFTFHRLFYYNSAFNAENEVFYEINSKDVLRKELKQTSFMPLKTLNVFSGCGGLAEGLHQSGAAEITWAVEIDKTTSYAYTLNFPSVTMFPKDCNEFLKDLLSGRTKDRRGVSYPKKGEVEFICGGPPCQGFSTMNRYSSKEESTYNNSLILTFLSICDYYRPKYIVMENVKNFVTYRNGIFFKHALKSLLAMGYQCNYDVLQAGNFGLPQNRKRLFIIAAAPGLPLPNMPKPSHVFCEPFKSFAYEVTPKMSTRDHCISSSAAYRMIRVSDAIWDLRKPEQESLQKSRIPLKMNLPKKTFYESFLMGDSSQFKEIRDHESKNLSPLNEARVRHIPISEFADWRDLPNIAVCLRDGSLAEPLKYTHNDKKNGKSFNGALRGVCSCASGGSCNPKFRQNNTLIPWCLVHTANRNKNWAGLYGRLSWNGLFSTVTTNPEPSGQQGRVLHPEEDRTVSVRECARAQGMPDSFKFFGSVGERFKQVGNAVPPPMARAIGREIVKTLRLVYQKTAPEFENNKFYLKS